MGTRGLKGGNPGLKGGLDLNDPEIQRALADLDSSDLQSLAEFIKATGYIGGVGKLVAAIVEFKSRNDNPTQLCNKPEGCWQQA